MQVYFEILDRYFWLLAGWPVAAWSFWRIHRSLRKAIEEGRAEEGRVQKLALAVSLFLLLPGLFVGVVQKAGGFSGLEYFLTPGWGAPWIVTVKITLLFSYLLPIVWVWQSQSLSLVPLMENGLFHPKKRANQIGITLLCVGGAIFFVVLAESGFAIHLFSQAREEFLAP